MVRFSLMGTVLTKVVKERPLPRVKLITLVLGSSACAVTLTSGTCGGNPGCDSDQHIAPGSTAAWLLQSLRRMMTWAERKLWRSKDMVRCEKVYL